MQNSHLENPDRAGCLNLLPVFLSFYHFGTRMCNEYAKTGIKNII